MGHNDHVARRGSLLLASVLLCLTVAYCQDEEFASTFRQGTEALRAGNLEAAAGAFTRCTGLDPTFAEAWLNLGLARFQQNNLDSAVPALEKSLQLKPAIRGANLFLGIA